MGKRSSEIEFSKHLRAQIGKRLIEARKKKGIMQKDVIPANRPLINKIENGKCMVRYEKVESGKKKNEKNFMTYKNAREICILLDMKIEEFVFGKGSTLNSNVKWIIEQAVFKNVRFNTLDNNEELTPNSGFGELFEDFIMYDAELSRIKKNYQYQEKIGQYAPLQTNDEQDIKNLRKEIISETNLGKKRKLENVLRVFEDIKKSNDHHKNDLSQELENFDRKYKEQLKITLEEFLKSDVIENDYAEDVEEEDKIYKPISMLNWLRKSFENNIIAGVYDRKKRYVVSRWKTVTDKKGEKKKEYVFSLLKLDAEIDYWLNTNVANKIIELKREYLEDPISSIGYQVFNLLSLRNEMAVSNILSSGYGIDDELFDIYEESALKMSNYQKSVKSDEYRSMIEDFEKHQKIQDDIRAEVYREEFKAYEEEKKKKNNENKISKR